MSVIETIHLLMQFHKLVSQMDSAELLLEASVLWRQHLHIKAKAGRIPRYLHFQSSVGSYQASCPGAACGRARS